MPNLNIHQAVEAVKAHIAGVSDLMPTGDLRLEEFSYEVERNEWIITISTMDNPVTMNRIYKTFFVNDSSGSVTAMKMRNPFAPA